MLRSGDFSLDIGNERLVCGDTPLDLPPRAFQLLRYLMERPGQLVTKRQLLDALWPEAFVEEAVLKAYVSQIRKALRDQAGTPRYIETVHRRGYRFIAPIQEVELGRQDARAEASGPAALIGRAGELDRLCMFFGRALDGDRQVVFVTGEPGIGKTALVDEFLRSLPHLTKAAHGLHAAPAPYVARAECCEQLGTQDAYLPMLQAFEQLCRGPGATGVRGVLRQHAPTWFVQMPSLLTDADRVTLSSELRGTTRDRMMREIAAAIDALTAQQPLVLALEDLQWSNASLMAVIAFVAQRRDPARLLIIASYRTVDAAVLQHPVKRLKEQLLGRGHCGEIELPRLGPADVAAYLDRRLTADISARVPAVVHERSDGNPLFMVQVTDQLLKRRWLRRIGAEWGLSAKQKQLAAIIPDGLRLIVERQLGGLGDEAVAILSAASAVGQQFDTAALAAATGQALDSVERCCEQLARRGQLLRAAGVAPLARGKIATRYEFRNHLYREVLYQRAPAATRARG